MCSVVGCIAWLDFFILWRALLDGHRGLMYCVLMDSVVGWMVSQNGKRVWMDTVVGWRAWWDDGQGDWTDNTVGSKAFQEGYRIGMNNVVGFISFWRRSLLLDWQLGLMDCVVLNVVLWAGWSDGLCCLLRCLDVLVGWIAWLDGYFGWLMQRCGWFVWALGV